MMSRYACTWLTHRCRADSSSTRLQCLNEVPSSYDAYRKQQHRWSCGPMQLWRKATAAVWASQISWAQKLYLNMCVGAALFAIAMTR